VAEFWRYRRLILYFGPRYVRQRHAGTVLGFPWLVIRPLITSVLFTVVFGGLGLTAGPVPYFLFSLTALSVWGAFEASLHFTTRSMRSERRLVTRLYFPRAILPVSSVAPALVEFGVATCVVLGASAYFWARDGVLYLAWTAPLAFFFAANAVALAIGVGFLTSVWNAQAKDVRYSLPFVLRIWFFLTPVIYPASHVPDKWRWLLSVNPMTGVVEGYKWAVLGIGAPTVGEVAYSSAVILMVVAFGAAYFAAEEHQSVDRM
jgi:lipopolysaccharide transport system permease protein